MPSESPRDPQPIRFPKTLSDWEELDYVQRRTFFRRSWRWARVLGLLLPLAAFAWMVWPSNHRVFQAGPLSPAHALFTDDCSKCHTGSFKTLHRLLQFDSSIRAVEDKACSVCHLGPVHHANQTDSIHCANCHHEHRGQPLLARVEDRQCLSCHRDLKTRDGKEPLYHKEVKDWARHPDFAHRWVGSPKDPGKIKFNHQKHLVKEGVFQLDKDQMEKQWEGELKRLLPKLPPKKELKCADCHQPDEAGRYMKPILYEQHCKECHPLSVQVVGNFKPEHARTAWEEFNRHSAPHVTPQQVREYLRNRLTEFIQKNGKEFLDGKADVEPIRPIPGRRPSVPVSKEQFDWVNQQLPAVERTLFDKGGGCLYCHEPHKPKDSEKRPLSELPQYELSQINKRRFPARDRLAQTGFESARWFPHSRFRHESHRMLDCQECHKAATSGPTSDVLMPTRATCQRCHDDRASAAARADCVTCHLYHPAEETAKFRGLWKFRDKDGKLVMEEDPQPLPRD